MYGFHALEALQVMMERRQGGETGVKAVTCLTGKDVWKAGDAGQWSWDLLEAALGRSETVNPGDVRQNVGSMGVGNMPPMPADGLPDRVPRRHCAARCCCSTATSRTSPSPARSRARASRPSCLFYLPPPPGASYFDCLVGNIEKLLETGKSPYPVERTLLTTGILDAAMESHHRRGSPHRDAGAGLSLRRPGRQRFLPRQHRNAGLNSPHVPRVVELR